MERPAGRIEPPADVHRRGRAAQAKAEAHGRRLRVHEIHVVAPPRPDQVPRAPRRSRAHRRRPAVAGRLGPARRRPRGGQRDDVDEMPPEGAHPHRDAAVAAAGPRLGRIVIFIVVVVLAVLRHPGQARRAAPRPPVHVGPHGGRRAVGGRRPGGGRVVVEVHHKLQRVRPREQVLEDEGAGEHEVVDALGDADVVAQEEEDAGELDDLQRGVEGVRAGLDRLAAEDALDGQEVLLLEGQPDEVVRAELVARRPHAHLCVQDRGQRHVLRAALAEDGAEVRRQPARRDALVELEEPEFEVPLRLVDDAQRGVQREHVLAPAARHLHHERELDVPEQRLDGHRVPADVARREHVNRLPPAVNLHMDDAPVPGPRRPRRRRRRRRRVVRLLQEDPLLAAGAEHGGVAPRRPEPQPDADVVPEDVARARPRCSRRGARHGAGARGRAPRRRTRSLPYQAPTQGNCR